MKRIHGSTLFEWLVTIGILLLLIAILVPALEVKRSPARIAETTALLTGLSHDIDTYYTVFNAYPGPAEFTASTASTNKISGNQNLLLGLTYAMTSTNGLPKVLLPGGSLFVDPTSPDGPQDRSIVDPQTGFRQYPPFYFPAGRELSAVIGTPPTWPPAGVLGAASVGNTFAFPAILDRFPDALPILYYRRNPRLDTPAAISAPNSDRGAYNFRDNIEYTSAAALQSSSGKVFNQVSGPAIPFALSDLTDIAAPPGTTKARAGYILISAGPNRYYGSIHGKNDNIVVLGGE